MKFLLLAAVAAFAGFVSAQTSLAGLPACARNCTVDAIPQSCNLNVACICKASSFIAGVTCCVTKVCSPADVENTIVFAQKFCGEAGVSDLPTAATCAATASSTTSSSILATGRAGGSTAPGVAASASSKVSELESSATVTPKTGTATASSIASSAEASATVTPKTGTATASSVASSAEASATGSNANSLLKPGMVLVGVAAVGAVALL